MKSRNNELGDDAELARQIRAATPRDLSANDERLRERFAARLGESAARPGVVPIEIDGHKLQARRGATVLAAAMKNGIPLMHVCGARKLCATCRVKITFGAEYLTPMTARERLSLRAHFSISSRTRLACQARIEGPFEAAAVFPLCGDLPEPADEAEPEESK
jgi:ferredoxin